MHKKSIQLVFLMLITVAVLSSTGIVKHTAAQADGGSWAPVEKAFSVPADISKEGVATFTIPRNISVTLDGVPLATGSDMAHEFSFMRTGNASMMVGEIMLKENEVRDVTPKLLEAGIDETALHNHLLREKPHIMWLHVHAHGDPVTIAKTIRSITDSLESNAGQASPAVPISQLETSGLDRIMGIRGEAKEDVYAFSVPRGDKILMNGVELPPDMDVSTKVTFQPLGGGKALAIGEFVLESGEVKPVLSALAENGVEVTALHSHMITESPRLFYLHCQASGESTTIANAMRKALDRTNRRVEM